MVTWFNHFKENDNQIRINREPKRETQHTGIGNLRTPWTSLNFTILKLFDMNLSIGYFPDTWTQGLMTPIFNIGGKFNPNTEVSV